jgi:hypothetical protein
MTDQGRRYLAIPGRPSSPTASVRHDAPRARHLRRAAAHDGREHPFAPQGRGAHPPRGGHLHRQRPRGLGGGAGQRRAPRRPRAGAGGRALRHGWACDGAGHGHRGRGHRPRHDGAHRPGPRGGRAPSRPGGGDPRGPRRPRGHVHGRALGHGGHPRGHGRGGARGAPSRGLRGIARLRPLRDGLLGRGRDAGGLAEGAHVPGGALLPVVQRARRAGSRARGPRALLGLAAARGGGGVLPPLRGHGADARPLRARRGPPHDRGGGPGGRLGPPRGARPRDLGLLRRLGPARRAQHRRPRAPLARGHGAVGGRPPMAASCAPGSRRGA